MIANMIQPMIPNDRQSLKTLQEQEDIFGLLRLETSL